VTQPYDADYWRQRAEEARALAEAMTLPVARSVMQHIAAVYGRLAERAERTAERKGTRKRS
jgi:CRP-like cAMP-binding protein